MAILMSSLAFAIAFAALWFANQAIRKAESFVEDILTPQIQPLKASVVKCEKAVTILLQDVNVIANERKCAEADRVGVERKLLHITDQLRDLREEIQDVEERIDPRTRQRRKAAG